MLQYDVQSNTIQTQKMLKQLGLKKPGFNSVSTRFNYTCATEDEFISPQYYEQKGQFSAKKTQSQTFNGS